MVKLASARESRIYGPRLSRNRAEYTNAGLYVFATIVLLTGFAAEFSWEPKSGLVLLLIASALMMVVNAHDLLAHLAGFDYRFPLMEFDVQLALVEFAVPVVQILGSLLLFLGILFLFIQKVKGFGFFKLEKHALNMLIAGPVLWGSTWVWLGIGASILFFVGGITNVVKVFKMQQLNVLRLEKLRGGAQERLVQEREGHVPLIIEEHQRIKKPAAPVAAGETEPAIVGSPTPYKDVLVRT
ncbi:uncharacterized protein LOC116115102 [Pistacia vera]|uniref:uncharacterized protein LOC116115102 n=1 Tax=Pistacia vera TaxID=55513 RepID=UPI001262FEBB|nr:uncharacterized protein LOC116115102 [Pistacia vera]